MENCPKCGLPVADGAKFCAACGTRMPQKLIKSKVCSVCGNTLNAGAKFCNVCGTAVPQDETPADEPVVDERNPEMESIEVPELHFDDTPVQNQTIPPTTPDMPTMDSVYLPGQEPAKPVQPAQPTAEEVAMASRTVEIPQTPTVAETPNVAPQPKSSYTRGLSAACSACEQCNATDESGWTAYPAKSDESNERRYTWKGCRRTCADNTYHSYTCCYLR